MSNEIILPGKEPLAVPEHLKDYLDVSRKYIQDVGDVAVSDVGLNFLKLVHGMSKEAAPGWNGAESQPLPQGTMLLSRDQKILPPGSVVLPLIRQTRYIKWEGRPGNGVMLDQSDSASDPKITKENGLSWGRDEANKTIPPKWTKYVNFWVISKFNQDEPAILSFYRTSLNVARNWTSELMRLTKGWQYPLWLFRFKLLEPRWVNDGKNKWPQFNIAFDGFVQKDKLPNVEKAYQTARALFMATRSQAQVYMDEAPAEDPEELTPAESETLKNASPSSGAHLAAEIAAAEKDLSTKTANVQAAPVAPAAPAAPTPAPAAPTGKQEEALW